MTFTLVSCDHYYANPTVIFNHPFAWLAYCLWKSFSINWSQQYPNALLDRIEFLMKSNLLVSCSQILFVCYLLDDSLRIQHQNCIIWVVMLNKWSLSYKYRRNTLRAKQKIWRLVELFGLASILIEKNFYSKIFEQNQPLFHHRKKNAKKPPFYIVLWWILCFERLIIYKRICFLISSVKES